MRFQFRLGKGFGEVYHLLTASYLSQTQRVCEIAIDFLDRPDAEEAFEFFKIKLAPFNPDIGCQRLRLTANIIFQCFYPRCLERLAEMITKTAHREGWTLPDVLPDQLPERKLATPARKLLIWRRHDDEYKRYRNSSPELLEDLVKLCRRHNTAPVILGKGPKVLEAMDAGEFYRHHFFKTDSVAKQLWFLDQLLRSYGAIANVGMMSGAMDGPAMFFGHKTVYLARHSDATPRMQKVSIAVPNLIWQQAEYEGSFRALTHTQREELEQNLWGYTNADS